MISAFSRTGAALTLPNAIVKALKKKTTGLRELDLDDRVGTDMRFPVSDVGFERCDSLVIDIDTFRSHERQLQLHGLQGEIFKVYVGTGRRLLSIGNSVRLSDQDTAGQMQSQPRLDFG